MFDGAALAAYIAACVALLVVPGPSVLYIVARSIEGGRAAGLVSALGIATGTVGHVLTAAVGLSALLAGSPVAYTVVRFAGAAYLVYLGITRLTERDGDTGDNSPESAPTQLRLARPETVGDRRGREGGEDGQRGEGRGRAQVAIGGPRLGRVYRQAILVNLLNPKTALFFLAFLPQFVDNEAGPPGVQIVVLGLILIGLGAVSDGTYAIVAGTAGRAITRSRFFPAVKRFGAGTVYVGLGVFAAAFGA